MGGTVHTAVAPTAHASVFTSWAHASLHIASCGDSSASVHTCVWWLSGTESSRARTNHTSLHPPTATAYTATAHMPRRTTQGCEPLVILIRANLIRAFLHCHRLSTVRWAARRYCPGGRQPIAPEGVGTNRLRHIFHHMAAFAHHGDNLPPCCLHPLWLATHMYTLHMTRSRVVVLNAAWSAHCGPCCHLVTVVIIITVKLDNIGS